jgi:hypothetical protein
MKPLTKIIFCIPLCGLLLSASGKKDKDENSSDFLCTSNNRLAQVLTTKDNPIGY